HLTLRNSRNLAMDRQTAMNAPLFSLVISAVSSSPGFRQLLEDELKSHLHLTLGPLQGHIAAGAGNPPIPRNSDGRRRIVELRRVGYVEAFGAQFESLLLRHAKLFEER